MVRDIILNDDTAELMTKAGDWQLDDSTRQHEKLLIDSDKGAWRQNPTARVGIQRYLLDEAPGDLISVIKAELRNDGMRVDSVRQDADKGEITVEAAYE